MSCSGAGGGRTSWLSDGLCCKSGKYEEIKCEGIFRSGADSSTVAATTRMCLCLEGTSHDLFLMRQRSCCYESKNTFLSIFSIIVILSSIGFVLSIYKVIKLAELQHQQTQKKLKQSKYRKGYILILLVLCFFTLLLFSVGNILGKYETNGSHLFYSLAHLTLLSGFIYASIYAVMVPVMALLSIKDDVILHRLKIIYILFRSLQFIIGAVAVALYDDIKKPALDESWSKLVSVYFGIFGIEMICITMFFILIKKSIIDDAFIKLNMLSSEHKQMVHNHYMNELIALLKRIIIFLVPSSVLLLIQPICYLVLGYFSYSYIPYLLFWLVVPIFLLHAIYLLSVDNTPPILHARDTSQSTKEKSSKSNNSATRGIISDMTSIQSVTNVATVSDPVLLANDQRWRLRADWVEIKDNDGLPCYFNTITKEWSFDPPQEFL